MYPFDALELYQMPQGNITMPRPVSYRLPTDDFFEKGLAVKGFKGAMVFAPSSLTQGSFDDRLKIISQAEDPLIAKLDHDQLLKSDPMTGRTDKRAFKLAQIVIPKVKGARPLESLFIGGYRAFFKGDRDSKSLEVIIDCSHTLGPLRSLNKKEDPTGEWNQALDVSIEDTLATFKRYFPAQNLVFKAKSGSEMEDFVARLNALNTFLSKA